MGAAWSVPVVTLAAMAPAVAASGPPRSVSLTPGSWTVSVSGTTSSSGNGYNWNTSPPYFNTDGNPNANSSFAVTITTQIPVIAGKTYTFDIGYTLTVWNPVDATGWASVNGTDLSPSITTAGLSDPLHTRINGSFAVTYTATTTGTISFSLTTQITSTSSVIVGDDIRWTSFSYSSN